MTLDLNTSQEIPASQGKADQNRIVDKRDRTMRISYIGAAVLFIVALVESVMNFLDYRAWQILGDGSFVLIALLLLLYSRKLFIDGKREVSLGLLPIVILLAYSPGELFLEGVTVYNLLTGLFLLGITYFLFRPEDYRPWLIWGVVFLIAELVFSQIRLFPPFDINNAPGWPESLLILSSVLGIFLLIQLLTTIQLRTIQARMLVTIISLSLIPAMLLGSVTAYLGYQQTSSQIGTNLEVTSQLKVEQINAWLTQSTIDLNSLLQLERFVYNANLLSIFEQGSFYHQDVLISLENLIENTGNFRDIFIIGADGVVLLSTNDSLIDLDFSNTDVFNLGWEGQYLSPAHIDPRTNQLTVQLAVPLLEVTGEPTSVLVGDLAISKLLAITSDTRNLGTTGETYLVDTNGILLTNVRYSTSMRPGQYLTNLADLEMPGDVANVMSTNYSNYTNQPVIGAQSWLADLGAGLILEQNQSEAFESIYFAFTLAAILFVITAAVAVSFAVVFTRSIATPIRGLSETAHLISTGERTTIQPIEREDEIGELSTSLSLMTSELLQTSQNLENIVAERTAVLERRATYLETTAQIGRSVTEIRNLDELLSTVTHQISERFGFYHVGVFIVDGKREFAELRAANSEGGWRMLARGHKLRVGEQGIVGYVTGTGNARVQQQVVGEDSVYYNNPDLPLTRSELALPMISGNQILGCLDVQSTAEQAFTEEDVNVLQVLADEIAVAITNANLFQQLQERLETERRIFGQLTQESWSAIQQQQQGKIGFRADMHGVQTAADLEFAQSTAALQQGVTVQGIPGNGSDTYQLSVPVKVRGGTVVAVIETQKPSSAGPWTSEEIAVLEGVGEQLGIALENARLFEETQKHAQRERLAADLSGKIWASTDINTILQTAVRELGSALSASEGSISLSLTEELTDFEKSTDRAGDA